MQIRCPPRASIAVIAKGKGQFCLSRLASVDENERREVLNKARFETHYQWPCAVTTKADPLAARMPGYGTVVWGSDNT